MGHARSAAKNKRLYFTCSLNREMAGLPKALWACSSCEDKLAHENTTITIQASNAGMTVTAYVETQQHKGGGSDIQTLH